MADKVTASTTAAGVRKSTSFDIAGSGDKCFLCGNTIGEGAPIGFYQGKNAMLRCHRGCINVMDAQGGTPKAFHEFMSSKGKSQPPAHDKPVHQDVEALKLEVEAPADEWRGPRSIQFDSFVALQNFIVRKGAIPAQVRVTIGTYVMQAGG